MVIEGLGEYFTCMVTEGLGEYFTSVWSLRGWVNTSQSVWSLRGWVNTSQVYCLRSLSGWLNTSQVYCWVILHKCIVYGHGGVG